MPTVCALARRSPVVCANLRGIPATTIPRLPRAFRLSVVFPIQPFSKGAADLAWQDRVLPNWQRHWRLFSSKSLRGELYFS
jgi:hypothetical protein